MTPEEMCARMTAIVSRNERSVVDDPKAGKYDKENAVQQAERRRAAIPKWTETLLTSTVKIKPPRVFKAKSQYNDDMVVLENGLFVGVQASLILPDGTKHKVMKASDVVGTVNVHRRWTPIPRLAKDFYLDYRESELLEKDPELAARIAQLTSFLSRPLAEAYEEAKRLAPGMVAEFRSETVSEDNGRLAEKLLPYLDNNPLAALSPESLSLIFKTPWRELDRLVGFLKENRALAGGADPESVEYVLRLMTAKKVMDS